MMAYFRFNITHVCTIDLAMVAVFCVKRQIMSQIGRGVSQKLVEDNNSVTIFIERILKPWKKLELTYLNYGFDGQQTALNVHQ